MVVNNQQTKFSSDCTNSKDNNIDISQQATADAISTSVLNNDDKKENYEKTTTIRTQPPNETKSSTRSNGSSDNNNNKQCKITDKNKSKKTNFSKNDKAMNRKDENDDNADNEKNDNSIFDINACSLCHCCLDYSDRAAFFRLDREEDYKIKNNNTARNNNNNNNCNNNTKVESNGNSNATTEVKRITDTSDNHISTNDITNDHTITIIGNDLTKMSIPNNNTTATVVTEQTCDNDTTILYSGIPCTQLTNSSSKEVTTESSTNRESATTVNCSQNCTETTTNDISIIIDEKTNAVENDNGESNHDDDPTHVATVTEKQHGGSNNATGNDDKNQFSKNENDQRNHNNDCDDSSSFYFRPDDPYLPQSLYDPDNAIVYCDSCDRIFHQKCHFVPIVQVPKGEWHCLICSTKTTIKSTKSNNKKNNGNNNQSPKKSMKTATEMHVYSEDIFKSPPISAVRDEEMRWESDPRVIVAKAELLQQWTSMIIVKNKGNTTSTRHSSTSSKLKRCTMTHLQNARLAETALSTLLSTQQNRKYCYDAKTGTPSQELVQSIYKFYSAKYKLKCLINTIESIRSAMPQFKQWSTLLQWINQYKRISINNTTTSIITTTTTTIYEMHLQDNTCNNNNITIIHPSIDFVERILFPFGLIYERRWEPRTPEFEKIHTEFVITTDHNDDDNNKAIESYNRHDAVDMSNFENGGAAPTATCTGKEKEQQQHLEQSPAPQRIRKIGSSSKIPNEIILHDNDNNHTTANSICRPAMSLHDIDEHDEECPNRESKFSKRKTSKCSDSKSTRSNGSFSLDRLTCSACLKKTTSDDNDMILCDGEGCFRAYHMHCVHPAVTKDEVEQDESWFCPWCSSIADWMHDVQVYWKGDEWEKRKLGYLSNEDKNGGSISHSLRSWDEVNDVFPESDWEYKTSVTLKTGVVDDDGKRLLAQVLGLDDDNNNIADDDEDVLEIDGNFDINSYEIARKLEYEQLKKITDTEDISHNDTNEDSSDTHSSQVTLGEMSSVELEIGQDELAALSDEDLGSSSGDETLPDMNDTEGNDVKNNMDNQRRSKRLRKCADVATDAVKDTNNGSDSNDDDDDDDDPGGMNEKNIVVGKRNRKLVDYRRLNDAMFGDLDEDAVANLDGGDDFGKTSRSRKKEAKPKSAMSISPLQQVGSETSNNDRSTTNQESKCRNKKTPKSPRER